MKFTYPGPAIEVSYHNHSSMSDGSAPIELMCRAAKQAGLKEFGMSDHWVIPPTADITDADEWRMAPARLDEYVDKLLALKKELDDDSFTLKIGLEVDFFFENWQQVIKDLESYPMDYLIGSVHYAENFPVDHDSADWLPLSSEQMAHICEEYWKKLEGAAACGAYSFIGHPDLPKKFGFIDNTRYLTHALRVLDAVQKTAGAIELNTSGWFKECKEQYPSKAILKAAAERSIPVVINSDAHHPDHVARNFLQAAEILKEAGFPGC